eukprot:scaffold1.g5512.t1
MRGSLAHTCHPWRRLERAQEVIMPAPAPAPQRRASWHVTLALLLGVFIAGLSVGSFSFGARTARPPRLVLADQQPAGPESASEQQRRMQREQQGEVGAPDCSRVRRIAVIGERHSGTNLVEHLLRRNLNSSLISISGNLTAHKHFMQPKPRVRLCGTLVVLAARNAYDWAQRMHKLCYCCFFGRAHSIDTFEQFIKQRYWPVDVDIERNRAFDNIITMRTIKYTSWLNLRDDAGVAAVELVQLERLFGAAQQMAWLRDVAGRHGLPLLPPGAGPRVGPVLEDGREWRRKGAFNARLRQAFSLYLNPKRMLTSPQARRNAEALTAMLDARLEARLGYAPVALPLAPVPGAHPAPHGTTGGTPADPAADGVVHGAAQLAKEAGGAVTTPPTVQQLVDWPPAQPKQLRLELER